MGAAFQTSLVGSLSECLLRADLDADSAAPGMSSGGAVKALLSRLAGDGGVPQLDTQGDGSPKRQSIQDLNANQPLNCLSPIPLHSRTAMNELLRQAQEIFPVSNTTLTPQAQIAVAQLGSVANCFNRKRQGFRQAARLS